MDGVAAVCAKLYSVRAAHDWAECSDRESRLSILTANPTEPPSKKPRAVVLVHGIFDTPAIFNRFADGLRKCGFQPLAVSLVPSDGSVGLDELAVQLDASLRTQLRSDEQFDMVGFSMGGLVSRYFVQRLGGMDRVTRLITISAPHRGTYTGYAMANRGSKQMRPGSDFLRSLNQDACELLRVRFVSIWTPFDLMIIPAESSRLGVGEEFRVAVALHPWMLRSRRCLELVVKLLQS